MNNSDEIEPQSTPPHIAEAANSLVINLLPETSKKRYEDSYEKFMTWRQANKVEKFSENVLLAYFGELSQKYKSSTLWSVYSMLKSTLNVKHSVNIEKYPKLRGLLKNASKNYEAKKSKTLTSVEIHKFIKEAPDKKFLLTKVALVIALTGTCRRNELWKLKLEDIEDLQSAFIIKLPDPKSKVVRTFTVTGQFYEMVKRYVSLRPPHCTDGRFFLNYLNGKCTCQVVGINKFGAMPKQIAAFLNLPKPEEYTGHCFRRSSATLLVDAGSDLMKLKPHGGWPSSAVVEGKLDPHQGQGSSGSIQTTDNFTQGQTEFVETSTINEDPLDPLNFKTTILENIDSSEDCILIKQEPDFIDVKLEPDFVDVKQEPEEDKEMEILGSETEDGVRVKEEVSDDQVTRIYLQSRVEDSDRPSVNNSEKEFDIDNLDFLDLMFLEFAKKFKQFTPKTQIKVKSRICQIMTEAEMNDHDERRGRRS